MKSEIKKKAAALTAAGILSLSCVLTAGVPSHAEAGGLGLGDVGTIIQAGAYYAQAKAQLKEAFTYLDTTPEGQQEVLQNAEANAGVDDDPVLLERLGAIMENMTKAIGQVDQTVYDLPYVYFLTPDESFNAACSMGHVMQVNRGAFSLVANDDELAVVLGHEMGHGQAHHVAKANMRRFDRAQLAKIGAEALGGTNLAGIVAGGLYNSSIVHSDKKQEKEADALSWEYMIHSPYNPGATAAVWQRVLEQEGNNEQSGIELWFNPSDHPNHKARRDTYEKKLEEYSGKHVAVQDGEVRVNGKKFVTPAPAGGMSTEERAYFVEGNLATAYHRHYDKEAARAEGNTVMLGEQPILTCVDGDEDVQVLVERLNQDK